MMSDNATTLPDDLALCHAMIRQLAGELTSERQKNERLEHHMQQLLRWRYGPRSDRLSPDQMLLIAREMLEPPGPDGSPKAEPDATRQIVVRRRTGHGRRRTPADWPRKTIRYPVAPEDQICSQCGSLMEKIGEEKSEQYECAPARYFILEHVRDTYACTKNGCGVKTADKAPQPIEKGLPGPGLLAEIAVSKYQDHMPLNRIEGRFAREGLRIARSTMCDWMRDTALAMKPIFKAMRDEVLASRVIHTDDTPVPVLDRALDRTRTSRLWVYTGDEEHPFVVFDFTASRRREGPAEFLGEFAGHLQADCYGGYDGIYAGRKVIQVACWAHARRKFVEAQTSDAARSAAAVAWIRKLYDVEDEARQLSHDERKAVRQEKAKPLLSRLGKWLEGEEPKVVPKSPMGTAIGYALSNWRALERYCEDGGLDIDNNAAERAIRRVAIGRKNWLFCGSDNGGETAAVLYSICASCQRHGVNPWAYIRDILMRVAIERARNIRELLPDRWKPLFETELALAPMTSPSVRAASAN